MAINTASGFFMPSVSIPIGKNFSIGATPGLGLGAGGLTAGVNFWGNYHDENWSVTAGFGQSTYSNSFGGGITYNGWGASYYYTKYSGYTGPDGKNNAQNVGAATFNLKGVNFTLENDFFAFQHEDRWRTSAFELQVGNFVFGSTIFTNDGSADSKGKTKEQASPIWGKNRHGCRAWENGKVFSSPLYVGLKNGSNIYRFGYSHPMVQDVQQNGLHRSNVFRFGNQNYYLDYSEFQRGFYNYSGYYNPYALFNR